MTKTQAKAVFYLGTALSTLVLLVLTYNSLAQLPRRTNERMITAQVAQGKWVWQKHNCNDCHTILGIGGYYAPDVTKVMSYRDADWATRFLKDPHAVWPAARKMPNLHLQDQEIADVIAFLNWVNGIDTNNWPPNPMVAVAATGAKPGEAVYKAQGCSACHRIGGVGGTIGPDLTVVGIRRDKAWIMQQLIDPKFHDPKSIMPSFAKLPQKDREDLAEYLVSLK